jgi:hypothetical protein
MNFLNSVHASGLWPGASPGHRSPVTLCEQDFQIRPVTGHWSQVTLFEQRYQFGPATGHWSPVTLFKK